MAAEGSDLPTDFAVAVWRDDGVWQASVLAPRTADSLDGLIHALRAQPSDSGTLGFVSYVEEFFLAVRPAGDHVRLLLSDVSAAPEWPLAAEVLDYLGLPMPTDEDLEQVQPAGDVTLFEDLGLDSMEVSMLCENLDLFADEALQAMATRLGFGEPFEQALDTADD